MNVINNDPVLDKEFSTKWHSDGGKPMGIYIHVPFCVKKCPYCDFYSVVGDEKTYVAYTKALIDSIRTAPYGGCVDTVYFGGGTPNLLGEAKLLEILGAVKECFTLLKDSEITLEANPSSVDLPMLKALYQGGFNRISFGIQSTQADNLLILGRLHSKEQGFEAVKMAHNAGFASVSVDIMLGVPGQTVADCVSSAMEIAKLPINHISAYMLKLEPDTAFFSRYQSLDDDLLCDSYEAFSAKLFELGFSQYEISNYSKPGAQSKHNTKYWRLLPYIGFGPSAHSFAGGRRFYFPRDIDCFIAAKDKWGLSADDGSGGDFSEAVMLGLRLTEGISIKEMTSSYGESASTLASRVEPLLKMKLINFDGDRISLTQKGFLLSNSIINSLLN